MKKFLTTIIISLLLCNFSYSKDNPLKIFKKEILGGDAKKHMKQSFKIVRNLKRPPRIGSRSTRSPEKCWLINAY